MRKILIGTLWLMSAFGAAIAQSYPAGEHALESRLGEVRINSGFVSNFNVHTFYVYTFMFQPAGETLWHQLPIVRDTSDPTMEFVLTRTATADFTMRDAQVFTDAEGLALAVAQLHYEATPYDDDAHVGVETFRLHRLEEEGRWIFKKEGTDSAAPGLSVEDALRDVTGHHGRADTGAVP